MLDIYVYSEIPSLKVKRDRSFEFMIVELYIIISYDRFIRRYTKVLHCNVDLSGIKALA